MTRVERVTIQDIPLEKAPCSHIPAEAPAPKLSDRSWVMLRVIGVAMILLGLGYASSLLSPSLTGAVSASSNYLNPGLVAGILGMALVISIALSSILSHED